MVSSARITIAVSTASHFASSRVGAVPVQEMSGSPPGSGSDQTRQRQTAAPAPASKEGSTSMWKSGVPSMTRADTWEMPLCVENAFNMTSLPYNNPR